MIVLVSLSGQSGFNIIRFVAFTNWSGWVDLVVLVVLDASLLFPCSSFLQLCHVLTLVGLQLLAGASLTTWVCS